MKTIEDFLIDSPYVRNDFDNALITQASPKENHADDWEKSCLSEYKKRERDYYFKKQNRRCAYCRTIIKTSQASPEIEHIVHKSGRPEWMYESFNHCISCKMCNTKKGIKNVLSNDVVTDLPRQSAGYLLVHPHIDRYSQHINIIKGILYEGLTEKGRETIRICELDRYELAADRAEDNIMEEKSLDEQALLALVKHSGKPLVNVYKKFEERIHEICEEYKQEVKYQI